MQSIDHLPASEKQHFILCDCGEFLDMRDLAQVFAHQHGMSLEEPQWSYAIRKGDPAAFPRDGGRLDLN